MLKLLASLKTWRPRAALGKAHMIVIDFERLLRELNYSMGPAWGSSGSFTEANDLIGSSEALTQLHSGVFAFLAYNPLVEDFVSAYVESGALATDTGSAVMALFLAGSDRGRPVPFQKERLVSAVRVIESIDPVREVLSWVFPADPQPVAPGIVFFDRPLGVRESVFVPIRELDSAARLAVYLRTLFSMANAVLDSNAETNEHWFDCFCARMVTAGITYSRTSGKSGAELWAQLTALLRKHGLSIATAVVKKAAHL